jgi:hypothetical protein
VTIGIALASQDGDESSPGSEHGSLSWHAARQRKFTEMTGNRIGSTKVRSCCSDHQGRSMQELRSAFAA